MQKTQYATLHLLKRALPSLLLLAALTASSPHAVAAVDAPAPSQEIYEGATIERIEVVPEDLPSTSSFDAKLVYARLKTKVGDPFSQQAFDADLKTLAEEYDRVEPQMEIVGGALRITLRIWPKPTISSIQWRGNEQIKTKTLQKELGIKPYTIFDRRNFNKAFNKIKEYYIKKGYFETQLQYTLIPHPKTHEVEILIDVEEGRSGHIEEIRFEGFTKKEESALLDMIHTKKYSLLTSWITGTGLFHEETVEQDQLTIAHFLQNRGYADARVHLEILPARSKEKIVLKISADKGPIYHFGRITFDGNHVIDDAQVEGAFIARPGQTYSPEELRDTVQSIKDLYGRKGYIETDVQYESRLAEHQPLYDIHFHIEEGEQYKIGLVHVFGNVYTQTHVILRESLLVPGEVFDAAKLKATQERLENVGYFKTVNVYSVRTQEDQLLGDNFRDVYIEVQETSTGNVGLFFGLSSADSIFGGLDLSESNFNYKGFSRLFSKGPSALRGGGEYLHARASLGAKISTYSISWLDPYFRDSLWRLGFEVSKNFSSLQSKHYDIHTLNFTVNASYPFWTYWAFGTKYRIRDARVHIKRHGEPGAMAAERRENGEEGIISSAGPSISYDSTDSMLKPRRGYRSYFDTEFAGLGGDFTFWRFNYLNNFYYPLWRLGTLKYRFDFHFIDPIWKSRHFREIPLTERFFLGGDASVRGYRAFDLGPEKKGDPDGGISSSLLSVEYLQYVFKVLDAFVFVDSGAVSQKRFHIAKYNVSYGAGVRLEVLQRLPIILGMGFPVNPDRPSQVRRFFFSMGGQF